MLKGGSVVGQINPEIKEIKRGHGGARPGAGRKPNMESFRCADCGDAKAAVLARAVRGCRPLQFVVAALALGVPLDDVRRALRMSASQFASMYIAGVERP
jgi:hypothetical protein